MLPGEITFNYIDNDSQLKEIQSIPEQYTVALVEYDIGLTNQLYLTLKTIKE